MEVPADFYKYFWIHVLPGGKRQYAGGYSSHRGMSGYGGITQILMPYTSGNSWPYRYSYSGLERWNAGS